MINHHFVDDLVNLNINRIKDARQEMWQRQPEDVVEFSNSEGTWQRVGDSDQRGSQVLGGVHGRSPISRCGSQLRHLTDSRRCAPDL